MRPRNSTTTNTRSSQAARPQLSSTSRTIAPHAAMGRRPDRLVASRVKTSAAAERALDAGEEAEDKLLIGSQVLSGTNVRRLFQPSQRFQQSFRFLGSLRPGRGRHWNNSLVSANANTNAANTNEYNGGNHSSLPQDPRDAALEEQQRLLSMRCQASRSIRRQRQGPSLIEWFMEEPKHTDDSSTRNTDKGHPNKMPIHLPLHLPWNRNNTKCPKLHSKNVRLVEQAPETQPQPIVHTEGDGDNMICRGSIVPMPKKKRWRLWLPHRKHPIELQHPSHSVTASNSVSFLHSQAQRQEKSIVQAQSSSKYLELFDALPFSSLRSASIRSDRVDIHSNQPLLKRGPRVVISKATFGSEDCLDEDEDTIQEHHQQHQTDQYSQTTASPLVSFVPKHVHMKHPTSRGSLLVQQISGLSTATTTCKESSWRPPVNNKNGDDDDDDDHLFSTVQELLDSTAHTGQKGRMLEVEALPLTHQHRPQQQQHQQQQQQHKPLEPEGGRLHYSFEDYDNSGDDGFLQNLSTQGHAATSSRPTYPNPQEFLGSNYSMRSSSDHASTAYMQKHKLFLLECPKEEGESEDMTGSDRVNSDDPRFGVDPSFGTSTRKLSSTSASTSTASAKALTGSLNSTHASQDSSGSFHKELLDMMGEIDPSSRSDHSFPTYKGFATTCTNDSTKPRRKTLLRQNEIRGGVFALCAEEVRAEEEEEEEEEKEEDMFAARSTANSKEQSSSSSIDAPPTNKREPYSPPLPLMASNPLAVHLKGNEEGAASTTPNAPAPKGQTTSTHKAISDPPGMLPSQQDRVTAPTAEVDWESNLYVVWDEDVEKEPFIYAAGGGEGCAGAGDNGSVPLKELEAALPNDKVHDVRSVCSDPCFDDSFYSTMDDLDLSDPKQRRWLMAWDDLSLL